MPQARLPFGKQPYQNIDELALEGFSEVLINGSINEAENIVEVLICNYRESAGCYSR